MIAVVWALMYPAMLLMFGSYTLLYNSEPSFSTTAKATFIMIMMAALPLVAFWSVSQMKRSDDQKAASKRVLLYILVATPPAYILVGTIAGFVWFWELAADNLDDDYIDVVFYCPGEEIQAIR